MRPLFLALILAFPPILLADGLVRPPRDYTGSLEEKAQEAIIVFTPGTEETSAKQEMILKIQVEGNIDDFAWVVPLPSPPKTEKADPDLFEELFDYVDARLRTRSPGKRRTDEKAGALNAAPAAEAKVEVISRDTVGSFEVAVVRENTPDALNEWLTENGYQAVEGAEETIAFYRESGFVFTCIKVTDAKRPGGKRGRDLHPLKFFFETGGRDGIFFPMRLTGHQAEPFDVNLYVFYQAWLNDKLNGFGYVYRDFFLNYRDWDTSDCKPNAGKRWDIPSKDPFLKSLAHKVPVVADYFARHHPGERFYLTNLQARNLKPKSIRKWPGDLWMFPYYTNRKFTPYDARPGGPAEKAFAGTPDAEDAAVAEAGR